MGLGFPSRDGVVIWQEKVAAWVGRLLFVAALWSLISIPFRERGFTTVIADIFGILNIPSEPSLFVVALLFALAGGVRRRFRVAFWVTFVVMALSVAEQVRWLVALAMDRVPDVGDGGLHGPIGRAWWELRESPVVAAIVLAIEIGLLVLFLGARSRFPARLAHGSRRSALAVLVIGLLVSWATTLVLTLIFPNTLSSLPKMFAWSVRSAVGVSTPPDEPGFSGMVGHHSIYVIAGFISAVALVLAVLVLLRGARGQGHSDADDELAVRQLLLEHGEGDSLGYFATRRDKSIIFSPDRSAALTYRIEGSVCVASADPIGRRSAWPAVIDTWLTECRRHGWYAAVLSSSEDGSRAYVDAGLRAFALGDEAIIDTDAFDLPGAHMRPVRQAVNRVERAGYTTQVRRHRDLEPAELEQLAQLAEAWRGEETERGFSMALNRLGDPADGRCVVISAHDENGDIRGFLSFVPWGSTGLSLDLMRRDHHAVNGLNEFLVARMAEAAPSLGVHRISLNFAVFRNVFSAADQVGAGPITRASDAVLSFVSRFYQLESLYRSNDKYHPRWVPRLLCYDPALTVARAGIAMGVAEGFLTLPGPAVLVGEKVNTQQPPRPEPDFVAKVRAQEERAATLDVGQRRRSEQHLVRQRKLQALVEAGMPAHPWTVPQATPVSDLVAATAVPAPGSYTDQVVTVAGRVRGLRDFGGVTFAVLVDHGASLQVMIEAERTPARVRDLWRRGIDLGDLVSVTGVLCASRSGELSVLMQDWRLVAKALVPVPPLRARLGDEARVRNRSLDLATDQGAIEVLRKRAAGVASLRQQLTGRGFTEVETPMMHAVHGGATARPFRTHINAYNADLYLRIAPELYLKRLAAGGMERIFEVGRNFRNEGADATHNPEFTSLEAYAAYADYTDMADLTEELIRGTAIAVHGAPIALRHQDGQRIEVDLSAPWPRRTVHEAVSLATGNAIDTSTSASELLRISRASGLDPLGDATPGQLVMDLYEEFVESVTTEPTFYFDFPAEVTPLARGHRRDPALVEQWDLVAWGAEIGTAYSELTDATEQRRRLTAQSLAAAAGDPEAMELDEDFLAALELGLPPTGGLGLGVDRVLMMLLDLPIRSTLSFPFVRPGH
ncbi:bifunctional lysylphosphatidylglycerol synthetase/lysine--tRNA ligase LysX [Dermacoccaceae bacterium W4C1]